MKKYIKLFEEFINETEQTPEEKFVAEMQAKLDRTKDLWEIDKIGSVIEEEMSRGSIGKGYEKFHFEMVPSWITKHWGKDMLYKGENLFDLLYKEFQPKFEKILKERGLDSQECYVGYQVGSSAETPDSDYYTGKFKMGFDIWDTKTEDGKSGWALFEFTDKSYIGNLKVVDGFTSHHNNVGEEEVLLIIDLGNGTFYTYKTEHPYKGLYDYFSDGGYSLRLD